MMNERRSKEKKQLWKKFKRHVLLNCKDFRRHYKLLMINLLFRAKAEPVLEAAKLALENIEKNQLTELKSFASPPETVKFVMNMVGKLMMNNC